MSDTLHPDRHRIDLALLLPDLEAGDACAARLTDRLASVRGVEQAHIVQQDGGAALCLHYDPNLLPLSQVERIARDAGVALSAQIQHARIPVIGMNTADAADALAQALAALPGMAHASVNYPAATAFVAWDTAALARDAIEGAIHGFGYTTALSAAPSRAAHDHDHGGAPAFLPHWMQERWTLLLIGAAALCFLIGWLGGFWGLPPAVARAFFVLTYIAAGYDVASHAIPGLLRGRFDTDVLMLAAALGAALLGKWAEGAFLLLLFALGHAGEHYAMDRARNAINALGELMPRTAQVRRAGQIVEAPVEQVAIGETVVVRPGDRVPVDGIVAAGASGVNQAPITGESVPVPKAAGDEVYAGSINEDAALEVRVTRLAQDNTLSRVVQLVAEAQAQRSPTQELTQRFTAWFVPAVLVLVVGMIFVPPLAGWAGWGDSFYRAMLLLVAASPCALAIGTPAAVLAGIAQAARNGVLIKGGVHLENLGTLRAIAFDKTGTLTEGRFAVTDVLPHGDVAADELLRVAAAVEQQSNHPLAQAVVRAAQARSLALPAADGLENAPGRGVRSTVNGWPVRIGTRALFDDTVIPADLRATLARLENDGRSTMIVWRGGAFLGVLGLADAPRPGVADTLAALRRLGVARLIMLTGDNEAVAGRIAQQVGVTEVRAGLLPADKLEAVHTLRHTAADAGGVAMVGDGVNDAPALAAATVGIAMGGAGTAVALETADVALMADDLARLPFAVGLSRASRAIIRQNLVIALGVILLLILSSVIGIASLSAVVVLHEGSTIVVVLNALRLLRYA